jgi:hypothetical protein
MLTAAGGVRIWNTDTAAIGDSVSYRTVDDSERREIIELFVDPVGWFGTTQVTGDSLVIQSTGGAIDTLRVRNNTIVADRDSSLDRIHQVSGRHLLGLFRDAERRDMIVGPNAEAIYYLEKEGAPDGAVKTSADRIVFELEDDDLKRIRVEDGVEGTFYPEALLPADLQLVGFRWMPERRPDRDEILADPRLDLRVTPGVMPESADSRGRPVPALPPPAPEPPSPIDPGGDGQPLASVQRQRDLVAAAKDERSAEPRRAETVGEAKGEREIIANPNEDRTFEPPGDLEPVEREEPEVLAADAATDERPPEVPVADELGGQRSPIGSAWVPGGIDVSRGGFTIVVASRSSIKNALELAQETAASLQAEADVVDVLKGLAGGRFTYRITVGQYSTVTRARQAMRRLAGQIPSDAWPLAITADM